MNIILKKKEKLKVLVEGSRLSVLQINKIPEIIDTMLYHSVDISDNIIIKEFSKITDIGKDYLKYETVAINEGMDIIYMVWNNVSDPFAIGDILLCGHRIEFDKDIFIQKSHSWDGNKYIVTFGKLGYPIK